jgi:hypothetical protein
MKTIENGMMSDIEDSAEPTPHDEWREQQEKAWADDVKARQARSSKRAAQARSSKRAAAAAGTSTSELKELSKDELLDRAKATGADVTTHDTKATIAKEIKRAEE